MHFTIRVDGGPEIGYGHLIRTSALAEELLAQNSAITVATTTPKSAKSVFPNPVDIVDLPSRDDPAAFVQWLETASPDAVFSDAYPVDTAYQQAVREHVPLAVLQDDARHAVCADLFINGNLYAADIEYEFVGEPPETCLGTDYVLLRHEIRARAARESLWRQDPERAVIMMGGSDIARLTPTVIRAFDGFDLRVDAIVGPGCSSEQEQKIHSAATACSADVRVACDPDDLVDRMVEADFGVSTASSTTYELLALGIPIVSIPVIDNQKLISEALQENNLAIVLQPDSKAKAIQGAIETYVNNTERRKELRKCGRMLVDGNGSQRVCAEVLSVAKRHL